MRTLLLLTALTLAACSGGLPTQADVPSFTTSRDTSEVAQGDTLQVELDPSALQSRHGESWWSSSDASVATVSGAGRVVVRDTGTVSITALRVTDGAFVGRKTFHVRSGVIFIGDSMTSQLGPLSIWFGPVAHRWVNAAVSGASVSVLTGEADRLMSPSISRTGVILAGFNDIYGGEAGLGGGRTALVPPSVELNGRTSVAGFLDSLVVHLRARGVRPIVSTLLPVASTVSGASGLNDRIQVLNGWIRTYAVTQDILLIDHYPTFIGADDAGDAGYFQPDGIHPNDAGRALLAKNAAVALRRAGAYPRY